MDNDRVRSNELTYTVSVSGFIPGVAPLRQVQSIGYLIGKPYLCLPLDIIMSNFTLKEQGVSSSATTANVRRRSWQWLS
jgi:hypothetical protein